MINRRIQVTGENSDCWKWVLKRDKPQVVDLTNISTRLNQNLFWAFLIVWIRWISYHLAGASSDLLPLSRFFLSLKGLKLWQANLSKNEILGPKSLDILKNSDNLTLVALMNFGVLMRFKFLIEPKNGNSNHFFLSHQSNYMLHMQQPVIENNLISFKNSLC